MSYEIKFLKPFGPSVLKVKIPEKILNDLNKYIDEIIIDNQKLRQLNHGNKLIGDVTHEFRLDQDFSKEIGWVDFLAGCTSKWIEIAVGKKITKFAMQNSWVVRQFENEYNPVHHHSGHISGAGFLKLPNTFGEFVQKKDKSYLGGTLNLIHGSQQFLSNSVYTIQPVVGDFYLFPSYLMHTVYPFKGTNEERRSISFNAQIVEEINKNTS